MKELCLGNEGVSAQLLEIFSTGFFFSVKDKPCYIEDEVSFQEAI